MQIFGSCFLLVVWFLAWVFAGGPDIHPWEAWSITGAVAAVIALAPYPQRAVLVPMTPEEEKQDKP